MPPKVQGESKRGLVVTLVFFVLATIGLGVATYYGFAEQDKKDAAVAKMDADVKKTTAERDFYRFALAVLEAYIDTAPAADSPTGRELANWAAFEKGEYPKKDIATLDGVAKELPVLQKVIAKAKKQKELAGDPSKKAADANYEAIIVARDKEIAALKEEIKKERVKVETQLASTISDADALKALTTKYDTEFNNLKKKFEDDITAKDTENKKNKAEFDAEVKKLREMVTARVDNDTQKEREGRIKAEKDRDAANAKLAALEARVASTRQDKSIDPTPRGKIIRVYGNLKKASIDLGRRDGLTPQVTFVVHGLQPNGKPKVRPKGTIEVLTVGEASSEVLITAVFHPSPDFDDLRSGDFKRIDPASKDNVDPIIPGDVLINPLWNPNVKTHIAIAGNIDIGGGGAVNLGTLISILEQRNIVVDAYVDVADGSTKGAITRRTEYILLGGSPPGKTEDAKVKAVNDAIAKMLGEAKSNGVRVMQPKHFFQETGFNFPRNVVSE